MNYDPNSDPDPVAWSVLGEAERVEVVRMYHALEGAELPNALLHAAIHVAVENQLASMEQLPAREKLAELLEEGLDRHDAIHAIGSVLAEQMYNILKSRQPASDPNRQYLQALSELTAASWLRQSPGEILS